MMPSGIADTQIYNRAEAAVPRLKQLSGDQPKRQQPFGSFLLRKGRKYQFRPRLGGLLGSVNRDNEGVGPTKMDAIKVIADFIAVWSNSPTRFVNFRAAENLISGYNSGRENRKLCDDNVKLQYGFFA